MAASSRPSDSVSEDRLESCAPRDNLALPTARYAGSSKEALVFAPRAVARPRRPFFRLSFFSTSPGGFTVARHVQQDGRTATQLPSSTGPVPLLTLPRMPDRSHPRHVDRRYEKSPSAGNPRRTRSQGSLVPRPVVSSRPNQPGNRVRTVSKGDSGGVTSPQPSRGTCRSPS